MIHQIQRKQTLNCTLDEAWEFFATPKNLDKLTPQSVEMKITHCSSDSISQGQVLGYKIKIFPFVWITWLTEITFIDDKKSFIDDQLIGPFKVWHHIHTFEEKDGKVLMTDEVTYVLPFGILGKIAKLLYVGGQVEHIFDERKRLTEEVFNS